MDKDGPSSAPIDDSRSPACCDLVSARGGAVVTACLQFLLLIAFFVAFKYMQAEHFFHTDSSILSIIIYTICALYLFGVVCTVVGVSARVRAALVLSSQVLRTFIACTDVVAISVVVVMAIGNRNAWLDSLPRRIVNEDRFERVLGPFWMYLSGISLHITVVANMCFMQSINFYMRTIGGESRVEGTRSH